jgi:hypothetical protein
MISAGEGGSDSYKIQAAEDEKHRDERRDTAEPDNSTERIPVEIESMLVAPLLASGWTRVPGVSLTGSG